MMAWVTLTTGRGPTFSRDQYTKSSSPEGSVPLKLNTASNSAGHRRKYGVRVEITRSCSAMRPGGELSWYSMSSLLPDFRYLCV